MQNIHQYSSERAWLKALKAWLELPVFMRQLRCGFGIYMLVISLSSLLISLCSSHFSSSFLSLEWLACERCVSEIQRKNSASGTAEEVPAFVQNCSRRNCSALYKISRLPCHKPLQQHPARRFLARSAWLQQIFWLLLDVSSDCDLGTQLCI